MTPTGAVTPTIAVGMTFCFNWMGAFASRAAAVLALAAAARASAWVYISVVVVCDVVRALRLPDSVITTGFCTSGFRV